MTATHSQLTVNVSNSVLEKLSKIKSFLSHKYPALTQSELLEEMAEICLNKLDPERKKGRKEKCDLSKDKVSPSKLADLKLADSIHTDSIHTDSVHADLKLARPKLTDPHLASSTISDSANLPSQRGASTAQIVQNKRDYIPVQTRRAIWQQNSGRCSYKSASGVQCGSQFKLELEHKVPVSMGGKNDLANLTLLCSSHNKWAAVQVLGSKIMNKYLNLKT